MTAATVCPTCEGVGYTLLNGRPTGFPCPDCCCTTCGEVTDTPPICARCDKENAND